MKKEYLKPAAGVDENLSANVLCTSPFSGSNLEGMTEEDYVWED